ncbi:DUF3325 family protein [Isoalcanivorax beigongshangi]|uniref:DUF3325 family protein n=1 Tax=Isoalcanivorax beigongshangi TaxID=3238810 RepID=A0ABV4AHB9_9GAMM
MIEVWLLSAALLATLIGAGWWALSLDSHWKQSGGSTRLPPTSARCLRGAGASAWLLALMLCLLADHATMAVLVWVMLLAFATASMAMLLAWRPQWLALWIGGHRH